MNEIDKTTTTDGIKSCKSYGQLLTERHESILNKLGSQYPIATTEIGDEVILYLTLLREMRPFDQSISFIDDLGKDS